MTGDGAPAEWGRLAHLFDEINESFINHDEQAAFLLGCRERFCPDASSALDLGCATGQHVRRLTDAGVPTVGVDISPRLIEKARGGACVCADMQALPLHEPFGLVFALNFVFSFLHTDDSIRRMLAEVRRVLAPGGIYVMDYHYYFPPEAGDAMQEPWSEKCRVRGQRLVMVHRPVMDRQSRLCTDRITYRFMEGRDVVREVESTEVRRVSSAEEILDFLRASGLKVLHHCARFDLEGEGGKMGVVIARPSESTPRGHSRA